MNALQVWRDHPFPPGSFPASLSAPGAVDHSFPRAAQKKLACTPLESLVGHGVSLLLQTAAASQHEHRFSNRETFPKVLCDEPSLPMKFAPNSLLIPNPSR